MNKLKSMTTKIPFFVPVFYYGFKPGANNPDFEDPIQNRGMPKINKRKA